MCENPDEHHVAVGYQVSPFDAPNIMTVSRLVQESTRYSKITDFHNFGLGLPSEDKESTITKDDLMSMMLPPQAVGGSFVMGLDMGHICHCVIMACMPDGTRIITHTEKIPLGNVRQRVIELSRKFRIRQTVVDALPYTETVLVMQGANRNLFGAYYVSSASMETHKVVDRDAKEKEGKLDLRQVNINRNQAFDVLMEDIRSGYIKKVRDENDDEWMGHMQDMKRVRQYNNQGQMVYVWVKSDEGQDHFHHATLYASIASQMLGVAKNIISVPLLPKKFKLKTDV